ncbi:unnamed protein product [Bursaphelenchus xylophilus]|uniref:(pine wood nematode) hypothetical protein n=1 Tax=Bursaphelenchus xylophilus TaxID=6326 RepID=A0A1I7RPF2_BURXY|nr:unnamed protein product [Bursaphelenchus xylophilus]CAG9095926.1 unnamed protein product [Bursaphelenchus xylophilus]
MSSKAGKKAKTGEKKEVIEDEAVSLTKEGDILLRVHAKPGAKLTLITDLSAEAIGVALAAPPRDGQANEELLRGMMEFLGLRKNEIEFQKGAKSRDKMLLITSKKYTVDEIKAKLKANIQ